MIVFKGVIIPTDYINGAVFLEKICRRKLQQ